MNYNQKADQPGVRANESGENANIMRLQKALAHAGVSSRRAAETLITRGRVSINGKKVYELGTKVDTETDEITVDGVVVSLDVTKKYYILNKPTGVISTMADDRGRRDLTEFVQGIEERIVNVGRLDKATSGLLILTNDGDLANKLAHPKYGVQKTYIAKVVGKVAPQTLQKLKTGIVLEDGPIAADHVKLLTLGKNDTHSLVEITLHSGKNRIVRRMLDHVGHPVVDLVRRQFGPIHLGSLKQGKMRELTAAERGALLTTAKEEGAVLKKVTAGRPGDSVGAKGMRGIAARGNPHGRGNHAQKSRRAVTSKKKTFGPGKTKKG